MISRMQSQLEKCSVPVRCHSISLLLLSLFPPLRGKNAFLFIFFSPVL